MAHLVAAGWPAPVRSATTLATQPSLATLGTLGRNGHYARTPEPWPRV
jgi:hypothetical protein